MGTGCCPACGNVANAENKSSQTKLIFHQGRAGGSYCINCGIPTKTTIEIKRKARNANFDPNSGCGLATHPLAQVLNFFAGKFHQTVVVEVPLCVGCKAEGLPEPKYIDFEKAR
jgi:hypothetical protein